MCTCTIVWKVINLRSRYYLVLNPTRISAGKCPNHHQPWWVWHQTASWPKPPNPRQILEQYQRYWMDSTKEPANTDSPHSKPQALMPNLVQVAMQLPVEKPLPPSLPKETTIMLPHTAPKAYQTYKTIDYKENDNTIKLLKKSTKCNSKCPTQFLPPSINHNLYDQPNGPTNNICKPYHPPKMKNSTSPSILKAPSTSMILKITT